MGFREGILEFSQSWEDNEKDVLICLKNNKIEIFRGKKKFYNFILPLLKKKRTLFYITDPTPLFIEMLD